MSEVVDVSERDRIAEVRWADSVWFSDVDDTLIDTIAASAFASEGVREVFVPHCGTERAQAVEADFSKLFQQMLNGYRIKQDQDWATIAGGKAAFDQLVNEIGALQFQVQTEFGHIKKWSREIFIKLAADKNNVSVTPELIHEAADAYWLRLTEHTTVFPDALELSRTIADHGRPLYLVTSSDARLKMLPDGQFIYDPSYSESLKRQRIELLREKGLIFNAISIGDPEDKPHRDFFEKAISIAEADMGTPVQLDQAIMLGDSFGGDLATPKDQLNFGLVVLREATNHRVDDVHQITTNDIAKVVPYLK